MNLVVWAEGNGVARVIAYRWLRVGRLPVPARRVGRVILVDEPAGQPGRWGRTAVCARLSSADQKVDLDRQVVGVTAWATAEQIPVGKVVTEVGSALYGRRRTFLTLLGDPTVRRIVMKRRDRLGRFGFECVQAVLAADGRELVVVDSADVDDDVVGDITEILTSICARLYGKRAAGACGCSSNAPNSGVWRFLIHGWVSTLVCGVWPLLQTLRARCLNKCRILARLMLRCAGCAASAAHAHAARKAHAATVSAPPNCPGCTVGSTMSVPTTCTC